MGNLQMLNRKIRTKLNSVVASKDFHLDFIFPGDPCTESLGSHHHDLLHTWYENEYCSWQLLILTYKP